MRTPVLDLFRPAVRRLAHSWFGLTLHGVEYIPAAGAVLVVPSHQTYADPVLVTLPIARRIHYMAWSRLFEIRGLSWVIRRLRAFPVRIDASDARAAREAVRLLTAGRVVMIFPEGGRSLDGTVGTFRPGAFRLAAALDVPVLPVTIAGGHACWPPGRPWPRRGKMAITYHPAIRRQPALEPRAAARDLAERARSAIVNELERWRNAGNPV